MFGILLVLGGAVAQSDDCAQALRLLCAGDALQNVSQCDACLVANAALLDEYHCETPGTSLRTAT